MYRNNFWEAKNHSAYQNKPSCPTGETLSVAKIKFFVSKYLTIKRLKKILSFIILKFSKNHDEITKHYSKKYKLFVISEQNQFKTWNGMQKVPFLDFCNEHNVDLISKKEIVLNNHTIRIKYATYSPSLDEKHI